MAFFHVPKFRKRRLTPSKVGNYMFLSMIDSYVGGIKCFYFQLPKIEEDSHFDSNF